ncbi:hypothetical protein SAMN04487866_10913 [Thermoactinomyces sp. DSM 45891]|uniref:hypothetical protein n=1 Tax=Thermoactinomyces sp. DSM 45891 TaxID=1761907 RepID=UPI0009158FED|nr:hypothetical protein [Thermoactinomyces sp. DSM 45891]SFX47633.1 hypothetical protein SAMN04487866_10913 [Thermoactinomyces sp. DSM 45891]
MSFNNNVVKNVFTSVCEMKEDRGLKDAEKRELEDVLGILAEIDLELGSGSEKDLFDVLARKIKECESKHKEDPTI